MALIKLLLSALQAIGFVLISPSPSVTRCTHPSVRKEWRTLSSTERASWIEAVKCLASLPHTDALTPYVKPDDIVPVNTSGSYYDDLVYMHMDMNYLIHFTGLFLPWHRWYLHVYEIALRKKCGFTGSSPYWDWTKDASDFFGSSFFKDSDPESGLGGWGDLNHDAHVLDGGFSVHSSFRLSYPSPHPLRRNFTLQPYYNLGSLTQFIKNLDLYANTTFTKLEVEKMVNSFIGDYKGFQTYLEGIQGAHAAAHFIMGGDLGGTCPGDAPPGCTGGPTFSANDPLFWLHHAMVDKIWADWQNKDGRNSGIFHGGSRQALANVTYFNEWPTGAPPFLHVNYAMPSEGMFPEATIGDVLSTTDGILCYKYE